MTASPARRVAREVVTRVREGSAYGHEVLSAALRRATLSSDDAAFATRLAYGALQTEGALDEAIDRHTGGKRLEPRIRDALRVAAYEIMFLHTEDRAAVHQGVELVKTVRPQASGLANAILRRIAEDTASFPWGDPAHDTAALARLHAHPLWLAEMWVRELGSQAAARVMAADNEPAPLFLAPNRFVATAEDAFAALTRDGAEPVVCVPPGCLQAHDAGAAVRGEALATGAVLAVDAAAQLVASLAAAKAGATVVEIGAGRGTKTVLMQAEAVEGGGPARIVTVDLHEFKTRLLEQRLAGFGVPSVKALTGDAAHLDGIPGLPSFGTVDSVLIDAPCSGLGTLRRHPEKRWRVTPDDLADLGALGLRLLTEASRLVRPGGFVVYSTCTLANAENTEVISAFLAGEQGKEFALDPLGDAVPAGWERFVTADGYFRSLPEPGGPDGHFAARLVRTG
jgi:16S rRNA (cytosine967-C5)-methyltransferase